MVKTEEIRTFLICQDSESLVRKLVSSQDIVDAIISRQELANFKNLGI
jgi:hypothetical protein